MHAMAAKRKDIRNLQVNRKSSVSIFLGKHELENGSYRFMLMTNSNALATSLFVRSPGTATDLLWPYDLDTTCHGQKYAATTVRVVSRQLEKVRVEQNHCQGLATVNAS